VPDYDTKALFRNGFLTVGTLRPASVGLPGAALRQPIGATIFIC